MGVIYETGQRRRPVASAIRFEVIVGKSVPTEQCAKCFGFVQGYDQKAKERVLDVLYKQGFQGNQRVVFLSDGAANLRQLQSHLTPNAQHILDCRADFYGSNKGWRIIFVIFFAPFDDRIDPMDEFIS